MIKDCIVFFCYCLGSIAISLFMGFSETNALFAALISGGVHIIILVHERQKQFQYKVAFKVLRNAEEKEP